jgi:predicted ester cyclase
MKIKIDKKTKQLAQRVQQETEANMANLEKLNLIAKGQGLELIGNCTREGKITIRPPKFNDDWSKLFKAYPALEKKISDLVCETVNLTNRIRKNSEKSADIVLESAIKRIK